ncbi:MAG: CHASE2 domain-containing protein [Cyanobacteria bacterium J06598_3]
MFLDNRTHYSTWIKQKYHRWFKQRRKEDYAASANQVGLWSSLVVSLISVSFSAIGAWDIFEQQSYNLLHQAQREVSGAPSWDARVVVIAIDEASVDKFGRFPWPRDIYAQLLDRLWVAQPAAIAFGVLFPDATDQDAQLAQSIIESANVVLAVGTDSQGKHLDVTDTIDHSARGFFRRGDASNPLDDDGVSRKLQMYGNSGIPSIALAALQVYAENISNTAQADSDPLAQRPSTQKRKPHDSVRIKQLPPKEHRPEANRPEANRPGANRPGANKPEQLSGELSKSEPSKSEPLPPGQVSPGQVSPGQISPGQTAPVSENTLRDRMGSMNQPFLPSAESPQTSTSSPQANGPLQAFPQNLFIPPHTNHWIQWPGEVPSTYQAAGPGALQVYSYIDVLEGRIDTTLFQNKIVVVGSTLTGIDPLRTPFQKNPPVSGVYLHAATINNLLNQSFLRSPAAWQIMILLIALSFGGHGLLHKQGAYRRLAIVVLFPLLWSALAFGCFTAGWWIPVAAPIGTFIFSAIAVQLNEQQEKQQLMALFSMNVSPGTAQLIWRNKGEILDQGELSAQNLTATVLFMDIRGFTGIAETLPSQQLLPWLNQYFETMTDCIMNHGGMVDKYIGDAIMAVFGAPVPRTSDEEIQADAIAAMKASIEMHERLKLLNYHLAMQNLPTIQFGIGIHTGPLIGGTVGNRHRLNYSLFGDTVNIAARLESMTKTLPVNAPYKVLLSADTYRYAGDFPVELFRATCLRGRASQTEIYTPTGNMEQPRRRKTDRVGAITRPQSVPQVSPQTVDAVAKAS